MLQRPCPLIFISVKWESDILVTLLSDGLHVKQQKNTLYLLGMFFVIQLRIVNYFIIIFIARLEYHLLSYPLEHFKTEVRFLDRINPTHCNVKKFLHASTGSDEESDLMEQVKVVVPFLQLLHISFYQFPSIIFVVRVLKPLVETVECIKIALVAWFLFYQVKQHFHANRIIVCLFIRDERPEFFVMQVFFH